MMNVKWTIPAVEMADNVLYYTEEQFGKRQKQKLQRIFARVASDISTMPKKYQKEPALEDYEHEYRYYLIFNRIKVIYKILDDENIAIVAVVTTYQSSETIVSLSAGR